MGAGILVNACASKGGAVANEATHEVRVLPPEAPVPPISDGMPAGFGPAFAAADASARSVVYYQQCAATMVRLRATGKFGPAASAPRLVHCERTADGVPIGGVFDIDSAFTRPRRLTLIRLDGARDRYTLAVDSARITREARLMRDVTREIVLVLRRQGRAVTVSPLSQNGISEVWLLPAVAASSKAIVMGGDIGVVRAADGTLRRSIDRSTLRRVVNVPAAGVVTLQSAEPSVPAVADIVVARSLAERGRDVVLNTAASKSALGVAFDPSTGSRFTWVHSRITP